jgi:hypothetical protein
MAGGRLNPINALDIAALRDRFAHAEPFRFVLIDNFLNDAFAREVAAAYPTFDAARATGFEFGAVNERKKVQISDPSLFPASVRRLSDALMGPAFVAELSRVTGVERLLADDQFFGAGLHVTGPHGRLDVHVDFNTLPRDGVELHRRVNLLLYLNPEWNEAWGGQIELWDADVKTCVQRYPPILNRCLVFEASDISFHGVAPMTCPPDEVRRSFAAYYYTREPAPHYRGVVHSTIFRARPDERVRNYVLMPAEKLQRRLTDVAVRALRSVKRRARRILER